MKVKFNELIEEKVPNLSNTHIVYRIINTITGKSYIGECKSGSLYKRFSMYSTYHYGSHGIHTRYGTFKHLYNSIRKYGEDKFEVEVLVNSDTYDPIIEGKLIEEYGSFTNGYNENKSGKFSSNTLSGKIYITLNGKLKLIKPDQLDYWIDKGAILGKKSESFKAYHEYIKKNGLAWYSNRDPSRSHKTMKDKGISFWSSSQQSINSHRALEVKRELKVGFHNNEVQKSLSRVAFLRATERTIKNVLDKGLELSPENFNSNKPYSTAIRYARAVELFPELFV